MLLPFFFTAICYFITNKSWSTNDWKTKTAGVLRKVLLTSGFTYSKCGGSHGRSCRLSQQLFNTLMSWILWMNCGGHDLLMGIMCTAIRYVISCLFGIDGGREADVVDTRKWITYSVLYQCLVNGTFFAIEYLSFLLIFFHDLGSSVISMYSGTHPIQLIYF
jgi:hypothetical protein